MDFLLFWGSSDSGVIYTNEFYVLVLFYTYILFNGGVDELYVIQHTGQ